MNFEYGYVMNDEYSYVLNCDSHVISCEYLGIN